MLKPILAFLLGWILVLSCSQEETNPDLPVGVPGPNASEAVVKLLIKGEAILPPSTRNMSDQTEGSYQDELQLLILENRRMTIPIFITATVLWRAPRATSQSKSPIALTVKS
ncbi:hypothetical protein OXV57_02850 [Bacteroides fragilis]|nr:hypothetical protein [Bacteroides fragilis]